MVNPDNGPRKSKDIYSDIMSLGPGYIEELIKKAWEAYYLILDSYEPPIKPEELGLENIENEERKRKVEEAIHKIKNTQAIKSLRHALEIIMQKIMYPSINASLLETQPDGTNSPNDKVMEKFISLVVNALNDINDSKISKEIKKTEAIFKILSEIIPTFIGSSIQPNITHLSTAYSVWKIYLESIGKKDDKNERQKVWSWDENTIPKILSDTLEEYELSLELLKLAILADYYCIVHENWGSNTGVRSIDPELGRKISLTIGVDETQSLSNTDGLNDKEQLDSKIKKETVLTLERFNLIAKKFVSGVSTQMTLYASIMELILRMNGCDARNAMDLYEKDWNKVVLRIASCHVDIISLITVFIEGFKPTKTFVLMFAVNELCTLFYEKIISLIKDNNLKVSDLQEDNVDNIIKKILDESSPKKLLAYLSISPIAQDSVNKLVDIQNQEDINLLLRFIKYSLKAYFNLYFKFNELASVSYDEKGNRSVRLKDNVDFVKFTKELLGGLVGCLEVEYSFFQLDLGSTEMCPALHTRPGSLETQKRLTGIDAVFKILEIFIFEAINKIQNHKWT